MQDAFWPTPGLISCTGVTGHGRWGLHASYIMHRMQSGGWPYSKVGRDSSKAPSLHAAVLRAAVLRAAVLRAAVLRAAMPPPTSHNLANHTLK